MIPTIIVAITSFVAITASILFFPNVRIKNVRLGTYWMIALIGAIILIVSGLAPFGAVLSGVTADGEINPLKILSLFFAMTFMSVVLDEVGFFSYLASKAATIAESNQTVLFFSLYALTAVLTVFTSNDVVILTLTPFIFFFCKRASVSPIPYLVAEFAAANTWSMMLVIGNPTNIYLATFAGIGFTDYFKVMALPTLAAGAVETLVIFLLFRKKLKEPLLKSAEKERINDLPELIVSLAHLAVCLIFLVASGYVGIEMWLVSVICAGSLVISLLIVSLFTRRKSPLLGAVARLPYELIPFVLSMFVIIIALNEQNVTKLIGDLFSGAAPVWVYGGSSFIACNLINNIPMSILFSSLPARLSGTAYYQAIYATVIGSNVGAFLTPIGALAGIMFTRLTENYRIDYGFKNFIRFGVVISLPTLAAALGTLSLILV